jgi:NRPS condensation-like uncharacterized protein
MIKVKSVCKQMNCTVNDLMTTLLSNTLHEYFKEKGEAYNSIGVGMAFSMR